MTFLAILSFHILIFFTYRFHVGAHPIVWTKYGSVEGESITIHTGQVIDSFLAVPYAKPPVDELRFAVS